MGYYKNKHVLITGGSGFIGRNFVETLLKHGAKIRVPIHKKKLPIKHKNLEKIYADLNNLDDCKKVCKNIDYIFHAAGMVSASKMTVKNPISAISLNLNLTLKIFESAMIQNVKKVLVFSSATTGYPSYKFPVKETDMFKKHPPKIYFGYGWSRRYTELLGLFVSQQSKTKVAICRPTGVYGNYDDFNDKTSHVIPSLIKKAVLKKNPYIVWGSGKEIRDFIHVQDLVRGCLLLLQKKSDCDPINIGSGKKTSIKQLVKYILKHSGHKKCQMYYDKNMPTTIPVRIVNTNKAKNILKFKANISLEEGIKNVIKWYKKSEKLF